MLTMDFRDLGDEDLSAAYLACGLVVQAFLLKHRYKRGDISDEQLVRLGRVAHRDAARFLKGLERDRPELARKVREVFPEFDPGLFLAGQRMPFARKIKFVRKRKLAAPRAN
ncbi:hypothetical protein [Haloferula sp. BvORR071]|uniref:hypothetical protein n=1 Tax=Haloferula sp. BvORR071 TaxID=1396141 RepID=UPI002240F1FB|nr:hypothetical protein [Haloferula sp. BvORR071]